MRRGPGIAALDRSNYSTAQYSSLSTEISTQQLTDLKSQLETFATSLRSFAISHKNDIKRDPNFRHAFQKMCASIGVDPLSGPSGPSSSRMGGKISGMWNDLLGLSDWQYELGIQIIDVCVSTRDLNGGLIEIKELIRGVIKLRTGKDPGRLSTIGNGSTTLSSSTTTSTNQKITIDISEEDILTSLKVLKPLGCGYEVLELDGPSSSRKLKFIRSIPKEFNMDSTMVLNLLSDILSCEKDSLGLPFVTVSSLIPSKSGLNSSISKLTLEEQVDGSRSNQTNSVAGNGRIGKAQWSAERSQTVLDEMLFGNDGGTGLLWIDEGAHPARYYSLAMSEGLLENLPSSQS